MGQPALWISDGWMLMRTAGVVVTALLMLSGCATWSPYAPEPDAAPAGRSAGFAELPVDDILDLVEAGMTGLESVTVQLTDTNQPGLEQASITTSRSGHCRIHLEFDEYTAEILVGDDYAWSRAPRAYYLDQGATEDELDAYGDVFDIWVREDRTKSGTSEGPCLPLDELVDVFVEDIDYLRAEETTIVADSVSGIPVVRIYTSDERGRNTIDRWGSGSEMIVEADPPHRILQINDLFDDEEQRTEFSGFDDELDLAFPAEGEYVDFAAPSV